MIDLQIIWEDFSQALKKTSGLFPWEYLQMLEKWVNVHESIVARYILQKMAKKYFWIPDFLAYKNEKWIPIPHKYFFWSMAHKPQTVIAWISDTPLWCDIEIYKEKSPELLNFFNPQEYRKIWEINWENFYFLWTAKESVIKYIQADLDAIQWFSCTKVMEEEVTIWEVAFSKMLTLQDMQGKIFECRVWRKWNLIYSLCH